jgi:hypothetical protein
LKILDSLIGALAEIDRQCERGEAIQPASKVGGKVDCFVASLLAMTRR